MSDQDELGHGNSIAAWTAVIVAMIGISLATLGWVMLSDLMMYVGGGLSVSALIIGPVLAKLGYGVAGKSAK